MSENLLGLKLGEVEKVETSVSTWQKLISTTSGLNDDLKAAHAKDRDAVTACQEHCTREWKTEPAGKAIGNISVRSVQPF